MQTFETFGPYPYQSPVSADENPAAHGGVAFVDVRSDGKTRRRNVNGSHEEVGTWATP